jgi:hypothetical protein
MSRFYSYRKRFEKDRRNWKGIEGIDATWRKWRRLCAAMEMRGIEELGWCPEKGCARIALARVLDHYVEDICHNIRENALLIAGV